MKINKRGTTVGKMSNSREIMAVVKILLQAWLNHDKRRDMKWWINQCFLWNFECFKKSLTVIKLTFFYSRCSTNDLPKPKFDWNFSNSLIIHGKKTKEIISVTAVWIYAPNYHKIRWTFALNFSNNNIDALRGYVKHSKESFIRYPNAS